jgi:hypothetical protein
MKLVFRK